MPTALPRHTITETPDVAAVLDAAANRHPGLSRQQLLKVVVLEAGAAEERRVEVERARLAALLAEPHPELAVGGDAVAEVRAARDADWPR